MTKHELLERLNELPNRSKHVMLSFSPNSGLKYSVGTAVTDVSLIRERGTIIISNAFSDVKPKMTLEQLIFELYKDSELIQDNDILFEVYCLVEVTNKRVISISPDIDNIEVISPNDSSWVYINIPIAYILD